MGKGKGYYKRIAFGSPTFLLGLILVVGALLRVYHLDHQSFWVDEALTLREAAIGFEEMVGLRRYPEQNNPDLVPSYGSAFDPAILFNLHGPLHAFLIHFWARLGINEFSLRGFSVLLGVAAILFMFLLGKEVSGLKTGLVSAFLLAISPFHIWHSQEVRAYILVIALSILSVYLFLRYLRKGSWRSGASYVATSILAAFSHPGMLFILLFENLFVALNWRKYKSLLIKWVVLQLSLIVIFGTWLLFQQSYRGGYLAKKRVYSRLGTGRLHMWDTRTKVLGVGYSLFVYSVGSSVGPSVAELHSSDAVLLYKPHLKTVVPIVMIFAVAFLSGIRSLADQREKLMFLSLYTAVPILSLFGLSISTGLLPNPRYASVALPAYLLILAHGIRCIGSRSGAWLLLCLVVVSDLYSLSNYYYDERYFKEDSRAAAEYVELLSGPEEAIFVIGVLAPFEFYFKKEIPVYDFRRVNPRNVRKKVHLEEIVTGKKAIWLVVGRDWLVDPDEELKRYLESELNLNVVNYKEFAGLKVYKYSRLSPEISLAANLSVRRLKRAS